MSNVIRLDDIRAAAEKKYGSTDIDFGDGVLTLVNPLRLPKERRKALTSIQDRLDEEGADQEEFLAEAIRIVASDKATADKFLDLVGDDLAVLASVFEAYTEDAQVGEASASQD